jgi:hypothetical protein
MGLKTTLISEKDANMRKTIVAVSAVICFFEAARATDFPSEVDRTKESIVSEEPHFKWVLPNEPICATLVDLAKKQQLDPKEFDFDPWLERYYLRKIRAGTKDFAVIVQTEPAHGVPGTTIEQIVLLTTEGQIMDRIRCAISSRYGAMKTSVSLTPESDGSLIIIRFEGHKYSNDDQGLWHNWHEISYHDKKWTFGADENTKPNIWNEKGLCRIGIADDKFKVIFPNMELPDFGKAKSLKVTFDLLKEKEKRLVLDDPKQVAEICKHINVTSISVSDTEGIKPNVTLGINWDTKVDFVMPDGKTIQVGFIRKDVVDETLAGNVFELDSDSFYQSLTKIVSKAEGRKIELGLVRDTGESGNSR